MAAELGAHRRLDLVGVEVELAGGEARVERVREDRRRDALLEDPQAAGFSGRVSDSGEGRWTAAAAVETGVPAHVLTTALYERFASRGEADFADKLLSAMRKGFGGHEELPTGE